MKSKSFHATVGLLFVVLLAAVGSTLVGRGHGPILGIEAGESELTKSILFDVRMPRTLIAIIVGFSLGSAGAALQGLLRNPLAEPGLIGTSSCASLGAVLVLYFGTQVNQTVALPLGGLVGALMGLLLLVGLSGRNPSTTTMILSGVAVTALANALTAVALNLAPSPYAAMEIMFWLMGSMADRSMGHFWSAFPFMIGGWALLALSGVGLDALTIGESGAKSLGISLSRLKVLVVTGTALSIGAAVSITGAIGFVALVVPHMLRPIYGHRPSQILFPSALGGAALLLVADTIVRLMPPGPELKLGVLTSLVGAPFFLWLLYKMRTGVT